MAYTGNSYFVADYPIDRFTATTGQTVYVLSRAPIGVATIFVLVGNTVLLPTLEYSLNGLNLTLANAPAAGTQVTVRHLAYPGTAYSPAPGSVTVANLSPSFTLPIGNGGTGQTTQQLALNALTGTQTSGYYLRSDGSNASLSAIQVVDVPTLNQNTTGSAGSVAFALGFSTAGDGAPGGSSFNGSAARTISYNSIGAPSTTGVGASGSWAINITGSAASVTGGAVLSLTAGTGVSVSAATGNVTVSIGQAVGTSNAVQFGSFGVGTAPSGTTGEIRATNNITAFFSDERLKNILDRIEDPLGKLSNLTGFYFEPNDTAVKLGYRKNERHVGLSAQKVQEILPEAVTVAPVSAEYLTIRYEKLIPLLVEGILALLKRVEILEAQ